MNHPPQTEAKWPQEKQGPLHARGSGQQKTRLTFGGGLALQDAVSVCVFFYVKKVGRQWREEQSRATQKTESKRLGQVVSSTPSSGLEQGHMQVNHLRRRQWEHASATFLPAATPPVIALGALSNSEWGNLHSGTPSRQACRASSFILRF